MNDKHEEKKDTKDTLVESSFKRELTVEELELATGGVASSLQAAQ